MSAYGVVMVDVVRIKEELRQSDIMGPFKRQVRHAKSKLHVFSSIGALKMQMSLARTVWLSRATLIFISLLADHVKSAGQSMYPDQINSADQIKSAN